MFGLLLLMIGFLVTVFMVGHGVDVVKSGLIAGSLLHRTWSWWCVIMMILVMVLGSLYVTLHGFELLGIIVRFMWVI